MADTTSINCPSCHKYTSLIKRASHTSSYDHNTHYSIEECNSCNFHVLVKRYGSQIESIWPNPLPKAVDDRISEAVKRDYEEALLCLSAGAYRGAAAMARRAVQVLAKEKGATKKDLKDQIDELYTLNVVTEDIKKWAHEVRYVGNDAAHPNDSEVTKDDAEEIIELLDSLCEVLYIAPARAANRKAIREAKKDGSK